MATQVGFEAVDSVGPLRARSASLPHAHAVDPAGLLLRAANSPKLRPVSGAISPGPMESGGDLTAAHGRALSNAHSDRMARKAAQRHKHFVDQLRDDASALRRKLEAKEREGRDALITELRSALTEQQAETLMGWLQCSSWGQQAASAEPLVPIACNQQRRSSGEKSAPSPGSNKASPSTTNLSAKIIDKVAAAPAVGATFNMFGHGAPSPTPQAMDVEAISAPSGANASSASHAELLLSLQNPVERSR